jgi:sulfite exporter TauE/SafE
VTEGGAERKTEFGLRAFAAVVSPTLLGAFMIVCVITGAVGSELQRSSVVSGIALTVGAILILGSGVIYAWHPERYEDLRRMDAEQLEALFREVRRVRDEVAVKGALDRAEKQQVEQPDQPA